MKASIVLFLLCLCSSVSGMSLTDNPFDNLEGVTTRLCIRGIAQSADGMIWLATETGLYSYDGYNLHAHIIPQNVIKSVHGGLNCMVMSSDSLVIGCNDGVIIFNLNDYSFARPDYADNEIVSDIETADGSVWIATDKGLYRDGKRVAIDLSDIVSLEGDDAFLYIGTENSLKKYSFSDSSLYTVQEDAGFVFSLLADDTCLWVGKGDALTCISKDDGTERYRHQVPVAKEILKNDSGEILVGTDDGLIVISDGESCRMTHDSRNSCSLPGNVIWSLMKDRDNNLWIGTDAGLSVVYDRSVRSFPLSSLTGTGIGNVITCIRLDRKGRLWLGGNTGLICVENWDKENRNYRWYRMGDPDYSIPHNRVRCIEELTDGTILVGGDMGLLVYDEGYKRFSTIREIGGGNILRWIYDIKQRGDGDLDIAGFTERYVADLSDDRRQVTVKSVGELDRNKSRVMEIDSILQSCGVSGEYLSAFVDTVSGNIFFGGRDLFGVMDMASLERKTAKELNITRLRVNDSYDIPHGELSESMVYLDRDTKFLEVMFSDFNFSGHDISAYRYRLDNDDWIPLRSNVRSFILTDIKVGSHTLEISSLDEAMKISLDINVAAPRYLSGTAILCYVILSVSIFILIYYAIRQRRDLDAARLRHDEMLRESNEKEARLISEKALLSAQLRLKSVEAGDEQQLSEDERLMLKINSLVEEYISDPDLNVNLLSELSGLSNKQLYRKIKNFTGVTVVAYIRSLRMKKAASMLEKGGLSVSEVMYAVGFTNPSYFTRCFQNEFGVTPSDYTERKVIL